MGLVKVLIVERARGSDRPKKQSQASLRPRWRSSQLKRKRGKGTEDRPQPWTEVVASGGDRHVNRLINLPGTVAVDVGRGHSCPRTTVRSVFPKVTPRRRLSSSSLPPH